ncbi:hypothetical protein Plhal304r1_c072g0160621 [Plasmopara halstedii]
MRPPCQATSLWFGGNASNKICQRDQQRFARPYHSYNFSYGDRRYPDQQSSASRRLSNSRDRSFLSGVHNYSRYLRIIRGDDAKGIDF